MIIESLKSPLTSWKGDLLVLGFYEGNYTLSEKLKTLDSESQQALIDFFQEGIFEGKTGQTETLRINNAATSKKLFLIGLGKEESFNAETCRTVAAKIVAEAERLKIKTVGVGLPTSQLTTAEATQAFAEGALLFSHRDTRFKNQEDHPQSPLQTLSLLGWEEETAAVQKAEAIAQGAIFARELVGAPANIVTPVTLAESVAELAEKPGMSIQILDEADCQKLGMGAYLCVGQASSIPPRFIHLTYTPSGTSRKTVALVGKGVTFDSGGLNIKQDGKSIAMMKIDMGGAAAIFGAAKAIAQLQPDVTIHFISAVTENMISGSAVHPGDIVTASNGKTIEVNNTDAEGRLTLADALVYAEKLNPDAIVDTATLTGACLIALGDKIAGLWSNDAELTKQLTQASDQTGEKLWPMPLEESYLEHMKSVVADIKNAGAPYGGSITAALFLKCFIEKTPWAHIDLAGEVWQDKAEGYNHAGANGWGVRLLTQWLLNL